MSAKDWSERVTPRAQTRQEVEEFEKNHPRPVVQSTLAGELHGLTTANS